MFRRNTIQRTLVYEAVNRLQNHATADEIYAAIAAEHPNISRATVYRNLNQLAENGALRRITTPSGPDRFDGNVTPHLHAICTCCGRVIDVPRAPLPDLCSIASAHTGMAITGMTLVFHGICSACSANNKAH